MSNLSDFINKKVEFLRTDFLKELKGEVLSEKEEFYYIAKKRVNLMNSEDIIVEYSELISSVCHFREYRARLLFTVNETTKQVIFHCLKSIKNLKLEGYDVFEGGKIEEELKDFLMNYAYYSLENSTETPIWIGNVESEEYLENLVMLNELKNNCLSSSKLSSFISQKLWRLNQCNLEECLNKISNIDLIEYLKIQNLPKEDMYKYVSSKNNTLYRLYNNYAVEKYLNKICFDKCASKLGDLSTNKVYLEYEEIFKALDKTGQTAFINGVEKNTEIFCHKEISIDGINIDDINEIKFRGKILYSRENVKK